MHSNTTTEMAATSPEASKVRVMGSWSAIIAGVLTSLTARDLVLLAFWLITAAIVFWGGLWVWDHF